MSRTHSGEPPQIPRKDAQPKGEKIGAPQLCMGMLSDDWVREKGPPGKTKNKEKKDFACTGSRGGWILGLDEDH
ncbi:hypothetical protein MGG_16115 [Pyricularia oryzae 70-15]|uniref:Uncharacterized protein n=1 Tax=Pyricularia oryzae (strain 70-15 / ATCC MYA-4617 / FGSC 8958) TaxID=242507 RepID=G4MR18_PYRO7|nr:uncharacterized protein MGG_16115 [Pyricularia oryzae 70-15]EHA56553.1 hypothetical protein MGG_16115 [Pyricularia oryzae 70-15]